MRNVYWLAIGAFLVATAELIVSGILNEVARDLGVSTAQAGQLVTAYSLGFAIGTPILVALTSRASRKTLLLSSQLTFVFAALASAVSRDYSWLLAARVLLGTSAGVFCVVALGSIPKLVSADKLGKAMGTIGLAFGSSMVLGVPIGTAMSKSWGWESIFYALAGGSLLVLALLKAKLPEIEGDAPAPFRSQFAVLTKPAVLGLLLLSLLWSAGNSVILTYMAPLTENELRLPADSIGAVLLGLGVLGIAASKLGGYGIDRWGSSATLLLSLAASFLALMLVPLAVELSSAAGLPLIGLLGFSMFVTAPALNARFVRSAPDSANLVLGMNTSFTHLGLAAGAGAGGWVADSASSVAYHPVLAGLSILLAFLLGVLSVRRRAIPRNSPKPRAAEE